MQTSPSAIRLPAALTRLPEVMTFVETHAAAAGVPAAKRSALCLAVEEAFVNICSYAFKNGQGEVALTCAAAAGAFVLEIADTGPEFDLLSVPEPDLSAPMEQRRIGGLGIHFIRKFTDHADWRRENGRNILRLTVHLSGGGSQP
ncbi:MAG: ATP-binding protein [Thermodesulfobacteriota bacterium]